jgi:nucleoside-diphosphate-sugar epimerase
MVWKGLKYYSHGVNAYIDVRDVVNIMIKLMEGPVVNERFILFSDHSSYQAFFNLVAEHLQKPKPHIHASPLMGELAWRFEKFKAMISGNKPFITRETARTANQKVYYENNKIIGALGYSFISLEQSIKDTAQHFLSDHKNQK